MPLVANSRKRRLQCPINRARKEERPGMGTCQRTYKTSSFYDSFHGYIGSLVEELRVHTSPAYRPGLASMCHIAGMAIGDSMIRPTSLSSSPKKAWRESNCKGEPSWVHHEEVPTWSEASICQYLAACAHTDTR
jgi:hypothetical protein